MPPLDNPDEQVGLGVLLFVQQNMARDHSQTVTVMDRLIAENAKLKTDLDQWRDIALAYMDADSALERARFLVRLAQPADHGWGR